MTMTMTMTKTMLGALAGALLMATAASAELVPSAKATPTDRACIMHYNLSRAGRAGLLTDREVRAGVQQAYAQAQRGTDDGVTLSFQRLLRAVTIEHLPEVTAAAAAVSRACLASVQDRLKAGRVAR
jgi:hypothetical protein